MKATQHNQYRWVLAAMFAALTLLATSILKIPTPTLGYIHLGDAFVLLAGILLGPLLGGLAAGIGSALSDLLGGYVLWVPGTFVVKFAAAAVAALLFYAGRRGQDAAVSDQETGVRAQLPRILFAGLVAEALMVAGYFFVKVLILFATGGADSVRTAFVTAAAGIPFNIAQGVVAIVLAAVLLPVLQKIRRVPQGVQQGRI